MRAKRSKKYRKLMHQYEVAFGFREPYQVLLDSNFLRATHSFKMDLVPALERTLQGKVKPFITKCSLASVMSSSSDSKPGSHTRPPHLPPPTIVPLRYCSHNEDDSPIDEASCLLSLLSPSLDAKKNKEHYILATADPEPPTEENNGNSQRRKKPSSAPPPPRYNVKRDARKIPGVPIIYVKRSVMILEPMSGTSVDVREGFERGKFKTGVTSVTGKRKREEDGGAPSTEKSAEKVKNKVKGPNPLSVKKPKKRVEQGKAEGSKRAADAPDGGSAPREKAEESQGDSGEPAAKTKRKRRHKSNKSAGVVSQPDTSTAVGS